MASILIELNPRIRKTYPPGVWTTSPGKTAGINQGAEPKMCFCWWLHAREERVGFTCPTSLSKLRNKIKALLKGAVGGGRNTGVFPK